MRFKSFNDRFEIVLPCTTNFMFICHCETLSKAVAAFVKYCQTQSMTDYRELYLICHIMNEISLNVNVNVKIYGIVVDGIVTRHLSWTELNDSFARVGKVDVMEIGSTLG